VSPCRFFAAHKQAQGRRVRRPADDESKIASEFVRAYMRKLPDKKKHQQLPLPISA
jgi:hypothetical protein